MKTEIYIQVCLFNYTENVFIKQKNLVYKIQRKYSKKIHMMSHFCCDFHFDFRILYPFLHTAPDALVIISLCKSIYHRSFTHPGINVRY